MRGSRSLALMPTPAVQDVRIVDQLREQRRAGALDLRTYLVECVLVGEVGIEDIGIRRSFGVEAREQYDALRIGTASDYRVAMLTGERDEQVDVGDVGARQLRGAVGSAIEPCAVQGGDGPVIRPITHVPVARAARRHRKAIGRTGELGEAPEDHVAHR